MDRCCDVDSRRCIEYGAFRDVDACTPPLPPLDLRDASDIFGNVPGPDLRV